MELGFGTATALVWYVFGAVNSWTRLPFFTPPALLHHYQQRSANRSHAIVEITVRHLPPAVYTTNSTGPGGPSFSPEVGEEFGAMGPFRLELSAGCDPSKDKDGELAWKWRVERVDGMESRAITRETTTCRMELELEDEA